MNLLQINLSYINQEDRLLLRVNTEAGEELRLWLTRRISADLLGQLEEAERRQIGLSGPMELPGAQAVQEFHREAATASADFASAFVPGQVFPLGDLPLLVTGVQCQLHEAQTEVVLHLVTGKNLNLNLNQTMVHCLVTLTVAAAGSANWGIVEGNSQVPIPAPKAGTPLLH